MVFNTLFFCTPTSPPVVYSLSLHDALPIWRSVRCARPRCADVLHAVGRCASLHRGALGCDTRTVDRKSTRLNSSHITISYAVFCLKKKKNQTAASAF